MHINCCFCYAVCSSRDADLFSTSCIILQDAPLTRKRPLSPLDTQSDKAGAAVPGLSREVTQLLSRSLSSFKHRGSGASFNQQDSSASCDASLQRRPSGHTPRSSGAPRNHHSLFGNRALGRSRSRSGSSRGVPALRSCVSQLAAAANRIHKRYEDATYWDVQSSTQRDGEQALGPLTAEELRIMRGLAGSKQHQPTSDLAHGGRLGPGSNPGRLHAAPGTECNPWDRVPLLPA